MPQTKSVIKGKSTAQKYTPSCDKLGRVQDFSEEDCRVVHSFYLLNMYFDNLPSIDREDLD